MAGTIHIQLSAADLLTANRVHARRTPLYWLALALLAVAGYLLMNAEEKFSEVSFVGLAMISASITLVVVPFVISPFVLPIQSRRIFRQTKQLQEPHEVTWDDDALTFKAATWSTIAKWIDHPKRREGEGHFILYINDYNYRLIPKRAFPDDATRDDFARLFNAKIKPA
jgi:YcxB-like protein